MKSRARSQTGFTIIEILGVVAIIGVLSVVAVAGYQQYISRARASDIVLKYDAIRAGIGAQLTAGVTGDCAEQARNFSTANLQDEYAQLAYGFEAVAGGYRPVLTVCSKAETHGKVGVSTARGAHDTLAKTGSVEKGALLTDSIVSFSLPLTDGTRVFCTVAPPATAAACTGPAPLVAVPQIAAPLAPIPAATGGLPPQQAPGPQGLAPSGGARQVTEQGQQQPQQPAVVPPNANTASHQPPANNAQQLRERCQAACRQKFPHGNSHAYRMCLQACQ